MSKIKRDYFTHLQCSSEFLAGCIRTFPPSVSAFLLHSSEVPWRNPGSSGDPSSLQEVHPCETRALSPAWAFAPKPLRGQWIHGLNVDILKIATEDTSSHFNSKDTKKWEQTALAKGHFKGKRVSSAAVPVQKWVLKSTMNKFFQNLLFFRHWPACPQLPLVLAPSEMQHLHPCAALLGLFGFWLI